VVIRYKGSQN